MQKLFLIGVLFVCLSHNIYGQRTIATEIKRLEQLEIESVQKGDTTTLLTLWAKDFVVNNPYNEIVTVSEILGFIRSGKIDYSTVERIVEKVTLTGNLAIVMGREIVTPERATENAGNNVTRRYTNIWIKTKGIWHLTARQATNILVK